MNDDLFDLDDDLDLGIEDHELGNGNNGGYSNDNFPFAGGQYSLENQPIKDDDQKTEPVENDQNDLVADILKLKGVKDPTSIKWTDEETGNIVDVNFYELSREDQMDILMASESMTLDSEFSLRDEEKELFQVLQDNDITLSDYLDFVKAQAIEEYTKATAANAYTVDSLTDEDIYVLDLKSRFPDLTDDELVEAVNLEKSNQVLWEKKVNGLRASYKEKEEEVRQETELQNQEMTDADALEFQETVLETLNLTESVSKFELDLNEKEAIAQFILGADVTGKRYIAKAIEDPETLVEMSWYAIYGKDHIDTLENYYIDQIKLAEEAAYKKGIEEGQKQTSKSSSTKKTSVVSKPEPKGDVDDDDFNSLYGGNVIKGSLSDAFSDDDY